jgi:hypothetical protein
VNVPARDPTPALRLRHHFRHRAQTRVTDIAPPSRAVEARGTGFGVKTGVGAGAEIDTAVVSRKAKRKRKTPVNASARKNGEREKQVLKGGVSLLGKRCVPRLVSLALELKNCS